MSKPITIALTIITTAALHLALTGSLPVVVGVVALTILTSLVHELLAEHGGTRAP